jgi:XTP/dITP diphosphohydrolase
LLAPAGVTIVSQADFGIAPAAETGATFIENAILKARHAAAGSGLPAIADDSGLVVDALDGAPGMRSARYAGDGGDAANVRRLLAALDGVPPDRRTARFVCIAELLNHPADPLPLVCEGRWEGTVAATPRGERGFGYDPVFIPRGDLRSAAELDPEEKNRLSHRGNAFGLDPVGFCFFRCLPVALGLLFGLLDLPQFITKTNRPPHGLATAYYLLRRGRTEAEAMLEVDKLLAWARVADAGDAHARSARGYGFSDFEDALQAASAAACSADCIVTRNLADFTMSQVVALSPAEFLAKFTGP